MSEKVITVTKQTLLPIGLVISLVLFGAYTENRLTTIENRLDYHINDPSLHHAKIRDMDKQIEVNHELLMEIKAELVEIRGKLQK